MAALQARDMPRAAEMLRVAARTVPAADMPWIALANAELALGQSSAAEQAIDRQLEMAFRDVGALLLKGLLRERASDARAAVSFYRTAIAQAGVNGEVPPSLEQLMAHAQTFLRQSDVEFSSFLAEKLGQELSPTMTEAFELLTGQRQLYFQQPSVFYYPGLAQRRFFEEQEFPWLSEMLAFLPAMEEELAAVLTNVADGFDPYVRRQAHRPAPNNPLLDDDAWGAFHFWRDGEIVDANAERCPATMAALALAPMPRIIGRSPNAHWSRLKPGAHITPHVGMLNCRLICHIPILTAPACTLRVGSETRTWKPGVPLVFDDSIEHEARNAGEQERVVLLFEVWRPEIPEADREAIARMLEAVGDYGLDG
jgi:aspartyl/asparaginyl beta-hydroxylase (cupin superfamily)